MPSHRPPSLFDAFLDAVYDAAADAIEDVMSDVIEAGGGNIPIPPQSTRARKSRATASTGSNPPREGENGRGRRAGASRAAESPREDTLYDVLEVSDRASKETITAAYRSLAARWHPDKFAAADAATKRKVEERMKRINQAYAVLGDEGKRREYDRKRRAK